MAKSSSKKTAFRPIVQYTLELIGGPKAGSKVPADTKAAARGMYDALSLVADEIKVVKVVSRQCTRDELNARPRAERPAKATPPTVKK